MNRTSQRGISLVGLLIIGAFAVFVLLLGFRSVPAVTEFMAIERIIKVLATEGDNGASPSEMRQGFNKRGEIDNVSSINGADLSIVKEGGKTLIEAEYSRKIPVVANVSLLVDFHASSAD
ncbi:DUF4845 domain-containing protein [Azoarcus olearius]|uniref:Conserved hypothetical secreted protein n=1 Tax=Azoarcus sp. (strain BH72) TaxID=418699 RepID=A1K603_AZOSB|nr:DUF4845 domain-containing protein [Azoarcus olearius]ANQ84808.1 hypothetical protein dqs_1766 [Azoarcus olearius]CAL94258.1 conserved hypothetical secreted protein [Azoarcus olearius]